MPTIKQQLITATTSLAQQSPTARLDAEVLLCHTLNKPRSFLYSHSETELSAQQQQNHDALIIRRQQGEPIAYITGEKDFWDLSLTVTPDVLIPRPETEHLVEFILTHLPSDERLKITELGTGSGAIAIAIACERPHWQVTATDYCPKALAVARKNASQLQATNIRFNQGNWLAALPPQKRYHAIISNPPYIAKNDPHLKQGDVRFEPKSALISGDDGLTDIRKIVSQAQDHLHPKGLLVLEHGFDQAESVNKLMQQNNFNHITSHQDLAGHLRFISGLSPH